MANELKETCTHTHRPRVHVVGNKKNGHEIRLCNGMGGHKREGLFNMDLLFALGKWNKKETESSPVWTIFKQKLQIYRENVSSMFYKIINVMKKKQIVKYKEHRTAIVWK